MRVVVDTNVFVSSFFGGYPRKIIDLWRDGRINLCLSKEIVREYTTALQRLGLEAADLQRILALFARGWNSVFTANPPDLRIVEDDPDDDKFIECAVALEASVVISGDRDLLSVGDYMGIRLLTPKQFLDRYIEEC